MLEGDSPFNCKNSMKARTGEGETGGKGGKVKIKKTG